MPRIKNIAVVLSIIIAAMLVGCASSPPVVRTEPKPTPSGTNANVNPPVVTTTPPLAAKTPRKGAFYQDDGPGDSPPNLALIPDAEPRAEPYSRSANKPYNVFGTDFIPDTSDKPFKQRGIGSWYGRQFHGQKTSSGEIYDMYAMTAAHPTLPLPSYAKVTNVATGQSVIVRVNDRGPFLKSRIMDLSYAAAAKLGYADQGSAMIEVERILPNDIIAGKFKPNPWTTPVVAQVGTASAKLPAPVPATPVAIAAPSAGGNAPLDPDIPADLLADIRNSSRVADAEPNTSGNGGIDTGLVPGSNISAPQGIAPGLAVGPPSKLVAVGPMPSANVKGFLLQLAAFRSRAIAEEFKQKVALEMDAALAVRLLVQNATVANNEWFRVQLGPYADRNQAEAAAQTLRTSVGSNYKPIIVFQP